MPVETGDEHVAEAVEQAGDRQQDAVGLGRKPPHGDVGDGQQPHDHGQERSQVGREGGGAPERGERVRADDDDGAEHDEPELGVTPDDAHHGDDVTVGVVETRRLDSSRRLST